MQTNVSSSIGHNWTMDIGHHCNALDIMTINIVPVIRTWRKLSLLIMQEHSYLHLPWLVDLVLFTILYGLWSCHCQFMMSHPYHNHYSISKNCAFILFFPWHSTFNIYSFWYQCHRENDSIPRMKSTIHAGFGLHSKRLSPAWSSRGRVSLANHHI